ncbi:kinase-like domain-containing protein [Gymnopilus junonius]|uniref:Kinase-like domain-containing protein n=1 Tax=Gymnopilus junonius TaxID=109634 RepID=A0A9P5NIX9_GYMJU|nr:kinase-like domain-containing protein [Gymnopilus junonius]
MLNLLKRFKSIPTASATTAYLRSSSSIASAAPRLFPHYWFYHFSIGDNEYVCMKSMVSDYSSIEREIKAYEVLGKAGKTSRSPGKLFVRQALDHFELPLGVSLQLLLRIFKVGFPMNYVKDLASQMLYALAFIHSAGVIHADLQANNILLRIQDEIVFKDGEEAEIEHPSARKFISQGQEQRQSVIFETRSHPGSLRRWIGLKSGPILCDFGEARTGKESYTELIQPASYRAPEVFLHCRGIWDFLLDQNLFPRPSGLDTHTADQNQLARMVALLGPPPRRFWRLGSPRSRVFQRGRVSQGEVPSETLESLLASSLEQRKKTLTAEESAAFLAFLRRTLTWTGKGDPWIVDDASKWR